MRPKSKWVILPSVRVFDEVDADKERALAGAANGLPAGQGGGSGATAPSPQLAVADALAWDEFDSHKE